MTTTEPTLADRGSAAAVVSLAAAGPSGVAAPVLRARPIVELRGVEKVYGQGETALRVLRDIDFSVQPGEYVAVIGPSGSGKSTLLNILGCLDVPTRGQYLIEGEDVAAFDDARLSRVRNTRIGFVFQSFQLVSHLSVLENVELPLFYARRPREERHRRCLELLAKVGLSHRLDHLPNQLSGGEKQRCAIARALTNDPALILADEPTGNLDTATSREILELFHALHRGGSTLLLITHDPGIAEQAPRRVSVRDGRIESDTGRVPLVSAPGAPAPAAGADG
jgi:putative ABC transport system ATP-binding protein